MRKLTIMLLGALAVAAFATAAASGAGRSHARAAAPPALCGTLYKPACVAPQSVISSIAACRNTGRTISMPVKLHAIAGLKSAKVLFRGKTIKSLKFKGAPQNKFFRVKINTRGLKAGIYTVTVKVTDVRGVTRSKVAHFSICKPKPVFTG